MNKDLKRLTDFLVELGIEKVAHTQSTYLAHLIGLHQFMQRRGCTDELCKAGMFHSIYGTERFQGFKLPVESRAEIRALIGERAERLAYMNCAMDRTPFDREVERGQPPFFFKDRISGTTVELTVDDFDDVCRIHLYDFMEQVPRSKWWDYRRQAYHNMALRLGGEALDTYNKVFAAATVADGVGKQVNQLA